jgi:hypothetical protein
MMRTTSIDLLLWALVMSMCAGAYYAGSVQASAEHTIRLRSACDVVKRDGLKPQYYEPISE